MKLLRLLILLGMFICSQTGWSQVFGYPGATWVFYHPYLGACFEQHEKWTYTADTNILGVPAIKISTELKVTQPPPFPSVSTYYGSKFFHVNGDTVWYFVVSDSSWQEVYNFSVQIGDSVLNPLANKLNSWASACPDSVPYNDDYSEVIDTGSTLIAGQLLRYYTVRYATGTQWPDSANQTFYERIITQDYWYPDPHWCAAVAECGALDLVCYKDNGMMTDSLCNDFTWFETLSLPELPEETYITIYPNPVSNLLSVDESSVTDGKYMIISLDGRQISGWMQSPLNVAPLEPGVYLLVNEARTWTKKFIKI